MATILKLVCVKELRGYARFAVLFFTGYEDSIYFHFSGADDVTSGNHPNPEGKLNGIPQEKSTNLNRVKDTNLMDVIRIV